jgi:hypothetical protein
MSEDPATSQVGAVMGPLPLPDPPAHDTARDIAEVCDHLRAMLIAKNHAYGDSALSPLRVFSRADPEAALLVRIDDKLSRIASGREFGGDDSLFDLIGYLVLLLISRRRAAAR